MRWRRRTATGALLVLLAGAFGLHARQEGEATATLTITLPADARLYFDGELTQKTGSERTFTTPPLARGKAFHYDVLARWTAGGKPVERTRTVVVRAGALVRVSFADDPPKGAAPKGPKDDKQVVTTKAVKRTPAATVEFKKAFNLPYHSLGTLGARIDDARRRPDPVALAHAASELAVAEKVSKKRASLTSQTLLREAAELAKLRRQVAEMKAVFAVKQQIANEQANAAYWSAQTAWAERQAKIDQQAVQENTLPTDAPRKVVLNNYTTQYVDLWVNGYLQAQVPPGGSKVCVIDQMINPTTLTAYGSGDNAVWGPRQVFGTFKTYTWNLQ
jgi:uncharacterized protein (TIGR03000 family)